VAAAGGHEIRKTRYLSNNICLYCLQHRLASSVDITYLNINGDGMGFHNCSQQVGHTHRVTAFQVSSNNNAHDAGHL